MKYVILANFWVSPQFKGQDASLIVRALLLAGPAMELPLTFVRLSVGMVGSLLGRHVTMDPRATPHLTLLKDVLMIVWGLIRSGLVWEGVFLQEQHVLQNVGTVFLLAMKNATI